MTEVRSFNIGDQVLALLPRDGGSLQYKFCGPFKIIDKKGSVNYCLENPGGRKKSRWVHISLLKEYKRDKAIISSQLTRRGKDI